MLSVIVFNSVALESFPVVLPMIPTPCCSMALLEEQSSQTLVQRFTLTGMEAPLPFCCQTPDITALEYTLEFWSLPMNQSTLSSVDACWAFPSVVPYGQGVWSLVVFILVNLLPQRRWLGHGFFNSYLLDS